MAKVYFSDCEGMKQGGALAINTEVIKLNSNFSEGYRNVLGEKLHNIFLNFVQLQKAVVVWEGIRDLPERQMKAVIDHENGHLDLGHAEVKNLEHRMNPEYVLACELQADSYSVVAKGNKAKVLKDGISSIITKLGYDFDHVLSVDKALQKRFEALDALEREGF